MEEEIEKKEKTEMERHIESTLKLIICSIETDKLMDSRTVLFCLSSLAKDKYPDISKLLDEIKERTYKRDYRIEG